MIFGYLSEMTIGGRRVREWFALPAFSVCMATAVPVFAQVEINGLIIDESRTMTGREFYREFFERWGDPKVDYSYNIVIREMPDARWGSILSVEVNGTTAWRKIVRPRAGNSRDEARESIPQVRRVLEDLKVNGGTQGGDLAGEEY